MQRYRCSTCDRGFSDQTFRLDYRLRRPELDQRIYEAFVSKVSHRQTARILHTKRRTVERRIARWGEHGRLLHALLLAASKARHTGSFSLDEAETFETDRRLCPLTVPVLIERETRFVLHVESAPLPARKVGTPALRQRKLEREKANDRRRNGSRAAVKACFEALKAWAIESGALEIVTDKKRTYPAVLREVFGKRELRHAVTSSKAVRDTRNPLFAINHTLAMLRDGVSRLVRRTWAHAKTRARLLHHLWIYVAWRNYVRGVSNIRKHETPAMALGVDPERWTLAAWMRWRAPWALLLRNQ
ncbi:MAG: IS1 family transposase [Planctomycetes bacterium]|nr:IS1 family transposase [Planctomycetota bacterium]